MKMQPAIKVQTLGGQPPPKKSSNVTAQLCGSIRVRDRRYQKLVSARNFDHEIC